MKTQSYNYSLKKWGGLFMYTEDERTMYFQEITTQLKAISDVVGIVQIGSGTIGYTDEYSDIDLMVATNENILEVKNVIISILNKIGALFIKEGKFSDKIFLLIPFFKNGLEMNISILPLELLNVKSPLWKIIFDQKGNVTKKMTEENDKFVAQQQPYMQSYAIDFEFAYHLRKLNIELIRGNYIYAMKMLDILRDATLNLQILNENKKLHQFKAYHTLQKEFINELEKSYPKNTDKTEILRAAGAITKLFKEVIIKNETFTFNEEVFEITKI